ncbi:hypothetical protein ACJX0J_035667, partial [Zea mays]
IHVIIRVQDLAFPNTKLKQDINTIEFFTLIHIIGYMPYVLFVLRLLAVVVARFLEGQTHFRAIITVVVYAMLPLPLSLIG